MRLDPPGFTGPPTSNDQSNGNDDRSSSSKPFELPPRVPAKRAIESLQEPGSPRGGLDRRCYRFETVQDRPETRHATAFHVSYGSVSRSEVRARVRAFPSILEEARRGSGSRHNDHEPLRGRAEGERDFHRDDDPHDRIASRRSSRGGCEKARTKRKKARGRGILGEHVDLPRIPIADATNASSADAFAHTAHNDFENTGDISVPSTEEDSRGEKIRRDCEEEAKESDDVSWLERRGSAEFRERQRREPSRLEGAGGGGRSDYTARFQEPITNGSRCHDKLAINGPTKVSHSRGKKYGLLFILYLLAWPLVCSTNPSGQFASDFAQSPSLGFTENLPQHNVSQISSLLSANLAKQQQQHQQQQQQQQQQHHRQTEKQHRSREQYVQDAEYGGEGHRRGGREEEEQRQEQQQQEQREEREAEESSYQDQQAATETVHPYNEYNWEVNQINPWLSACDLAGPAPADLQGSCGPPEVPKNCPTACVPTFRGDDTVFHEVMEKVEVTEGGSWSAGRDAERSQSDSSGRKGEGRGGSDREKSEGVRTAPEQCLFYLEESHKRDICRDDFGRTSTRSFLTPRENRYWFMSGLRLRHCCEHAVVNALAPGKGGPLENVLNGGQKCADALDKLLLVDALAARLHCEFEEVLARYDCGQPYSVIFNCTHCKEAYRKWVCSSLVPYFAHGGPQDLDFSENSWAGSRLRPCRSFCQSVEQRCPYLLPGDRAPAYPTQYAGEPTFLCRDPNIPETGEQAARALHGNEEDECCFHACSEERPEAGLCANCTGRDLRKPRRTYDPPTAPYCEIAPIQPASTGGQYPQPGSTESNLDDQGDESSTMSSTSLVQLQQGASLCGSGGVGSMPSVSSSARSLILPQLLWLCSLLTSLLDILRTMFWVPRALARLVTVLCGGSGAEKRGQLLAWLHRRSCRVSYFDARHGARWLLEKWVMVERRCRGWWCWCWWWWRWRRTSGGREKVRARWSPGRWIDFRSTPRDWVRHWTRRFGEFAVKWRWWWWWLYRWWRSRRMRRGSMDLGGGKGRARAPRGLRDRRRRKRSEDWGDAWHSLLRRRHFRLSSRKDPP
ncbi:calcium-permeable channel component Mid1 [Calliopsis andreniformis]|uniref:calcium-permeable channel component Mid1 n=1 Tax=Calliopsis andreniformis TaxID=337506 RepID=UPI003FCD56DE